MLAPPPPAVSVTRAMLWNWWVVLLSVVLFVALAASVAFVREPDYTATARLTVGRIDITSPGALSGYAMATQALATGYSRTVTAQPVAKQVAKETGVSVKDVKSQVSATPVAESPVFRVEATSPDEKQAVRLANASSHALLAYAARLSQDNPDSSRLYRQYREAIQQGNLARRQLKIAKNARTQSRLAAAELRVDALGKAYTASVQRQSATQLV